MCKTFALRLLPSPSSEVSSATSALWGGLQKLWPRHRARLCGPGSAELSQQPAQRGHRRLKKGRRWGWGSPGAGLSRLTVRRMEKSALNCDFTSQVPRTDFLPTWGMRRGIAPHHRREHRGPQRRSASRRSEFVPEPGSKLVSAPPDHPVLRGGGPAHPLSWGQSKLGLPLEPAFHAA